MRHAWSLAGLSAVVLLAGNVYANHTSSCCEKSTAAVATSDQPAIIGSPCSTCEKPCSPCKVKCCKDDADIEKLRAVQPKCSNELCIQYQVETKCSPNESLDLLVQIKSGDQIIYEKLVALSNGTPGTGARNKLHFKGSFRDNLDQVYTGNKKLIVEGNVVRRGSTTSIDRERERVVVDDHGAHGWAQPLYTTGEVLYTPVRWVTAR